MRSGTQTANQQLCENRSNRLALPNPLSPFLETTTCWDFPCQSEEKRMGDNRFNGVTPARCIANLVARYTRPEDLVVDCMAGSGTTIDVARKMGRRVLGFDLAPRRDDILPSDARALPLPDECVDLHFVDSPYSDNLHYSDRPGCIGKLSCEADAFYDALELVAKEIHRTLKPGGTLGWLIADQYKRGRFTPVGFRLFSILTKYFQPVDVVCLVTRNQRSNNPMWEHIARKRNFFLRGFKYLFIMRKPFKKGREMVERST